MLGRACLLASLVLVATFAGCIGGEEPVEEQQTEAPTTDTVIDANESTEAPDGRGDLAAFKETNQTETGTGGMMHSHDYWGGETRKILLEDTMWFIPLPVWPCRSGSAPSGDCYNPGTSIADIDIPAPTLVYEGTSQIEVLFKDYCVGPTPLNPVPCVPNAAVKFGFDYLTAADEPGEWRQGGYVEPGTPVILPVQPNEADMPHQAKSFWVFRIYTEYATSVVFNFTVTAVKGHPIVDWPPHPNLYADKTERTVLDGTFKTETKGWAEYWINGNDANWVHPDKIISYGTDRIEITVEKIGFTNAAGVPVEPDFFYLEFHNASYISKMGNGDLAGGALYDEASDGTTYQFTLPVTEYDYDTPYGIKSRWGFRFMARYSSDDGQCPDVSFITQGCQWFPYTLDYTMKIVAYGHSTAEGVEDVAGGTQTASGAEGNTTSGGRGAPRSPDPTPGGVTTLHGVQF